VEFCDVIRTDGGWTDSDNLELILGKLATHPQAMGVLTYSYLEQFPNRINAATVGHIAPNRTTISSGTYPISRPLFVYVKDAHVGSTTGLADFAAEFLSFCAAGANGYLLDEGLVPLPAAELRHERAVVARLQR
jgi:phosphate transport system substrate-binding protein